ncbi:endonuclease [Ferrovibrio terrae]|uniref:endonuclease n=1 Tax=Ferrovibrio terrae TaxID=2594003 RepID=UPI003137FC30
MTAHLKHAGQLLSALTLLVCLTGTSAAEPPPEPIETFTAAKKIARNSIFADRPIDYYCGCEYRPTGKASDSGGQMKLSTCTYRARANPERGKRLEWEHVMPAKIFAGERACWRGEPAKCQERGIKGRSCCNAADSTFKKMEADLHNLVPSVGELNGDRSDKPYGNVRGEPRQYGQCDFEIGGKPKVTEPPANIKGDVARIWFYMSDAYNIKIDVDTIATLEKWSEDDPVDDWERLRDKRVRAAQGNSNPFVTGH